MRRKRSSRNRGHDSNSIWATLEIQYKASRASVLERTARRDEPTQERVQTRSTFEDLKALKIIWDDVCPTGYEIGWGLAVVRVRWRLKKGCYEHLRLQYQTRAAHEKMRDTMREREIASLAWNEDGRRIHMDMLPTRPVIAPMIVEKVNADIPLSINTSQNIPVNQRETMTILPPLSFSLSGNSVSMSYVEASRATEPCPRRESTPEEHPISQATEPTTPQKGGSNENLGFTFTRAEIAALRESPSKPASYRRLGRVNTGPAACAMSLDQTESPNTSSASSPSPYDSHRKVYEYSRGSSEDSTAVMETSPADSSFIFDGKLWRQPSSDPDPDPSSSYDQEGLNSEPPSPTVCRRSDEELLRHLLVEEMARRRQLEDIVDAQKQYSDDVVASHASQVREVDGILANAQKMQATLLAQLAESQSDVLQLQTALNACKDKLVTLQGALVAEQRRRVRVTAMLENVRSQYETSAVPVVADALSFVDELTSQALFPTS